MPVPMKHRNTLMNIVPDIRLAESSTLCKMFPPDNPYLYPVKGIRVMRGAYTPSLYAIHQELSSIIQYPHPPFPQEISFAGY